MASGHDQSPEAVIWNRAALERGGPSPKAGDTATASLLRCHNEVMNGGMDFAVSDSLSVNEVRAGIEGYRHFGLDAAAAVFEGALSARDEETFTALEEKYAEAVPDDDRLIQALEARLKTTPNDFAAR
jgi:hypothetical protein